MVDLLLKIPRKREMVNRQESRLRNVTRFTSEQKCNIGKVGSLQVYRT